MSDCRYGDGYDSGLVAGKCSACATAFVVSRCRNENGHQRVRIAECGLGRISESKMHEYWLSADKKELLDALRFQGATTAALLIETQERAEQLSACQANELRLREYVVAYIKQCDTIGGIPEAERILATQTGDLSALREVCAKVMDEIAEEYGIADIELIDGLSAAATDIRSREWTPEVLK